MVTKVSAATIMQFKAYADKVKNGGNGNGYVDGSEVEVFKKKCKTAGIDNVDEIMDSYNENRVQKEAEYDAKKTKSNASVETAIIASLSEETVLRENSKSAKTALTIKEGVKQADGARHWWNPLSWFNNEEEILNSTAHITKENVLDVITDDEVIEKIGDADEDDDIRSTAINQLLSFLVEAAEERKIDLSNIIIEADGNYLVGRDIKDIQIGTVINDEESLTAVVKAARAQINEAKKTVNGEDKNKVEMLSIAAKRIDAKGNGNGYIDTVAETTEFKQFAAEHGYDVDSILEEIRDNEENGVENTSLAQQTIYNIFDPEQKAAYEKLIADSAKDISKMYADGLKNDDEELLTVAAQSVTSDTVMQILNDNPDLVQGLVDEYDFFWTQIFRDDRYQNYTTPILQALCERAEENGIEIDDIVLVADGHYTVGGAIKDAKVGSDATDAENIAKVIKALQARINTEEKC